MNTYDFKNLRQLILTGGSERVLNNLITSELSKLTTTPQWTAFCNVNGQVITTAWLMKTEIGFSFTCHYTLTEKIIQHIQHHALRHQFNIAVNDAIVLPSDIASIEDAIQHDYPIITLDHSEQFIPQMLGMQKHPGAINFEKGCYLGQEIIMRATQLGQVKRTLYKGSIHQLPSTNDIVDTQGKLSGKIINTSNEVPYTFNMVIKNHPDQSTQLYLDGLAIELFS